MEVLEPLRLVNRCLKAYRKARMGRTLSSVRRIERVFPPPGRLVVAMTFDDGPTASPARPENGHGVTESLLASMKSYGARGTFDVIGSTVTNYPDREGRQGTALWSGVTYDHYPEFGKDSLAGVVNQTALARRMLDEGHELANHGYTHVDFGSSRVVYGSRGHFRDEQEVYRDLSALHSFVRDHLGYEMRLGRPPHYIDVIPGGRNAYDVYARMRYSYLGASFDGAGWKPSCGDYRRDVESMVDAVRRELEKDPASLSGQIIFQKDGYNMSKQSPVVDALPLQLELLYRCGYEVVTVSELLDIAPFTDVSPCAPYFEGVQALARAGYRAGFRDNSFKPDRFLTRVELESLLAGPWPEARESRGKTTRDTGRPGTVTGRELVKALTEAVSGSGSGDDLPAPPLGMLPPGVDPERPITRGWAAHAAAKALDLS